MGRRPFSIIIDTIISLSYLLSNLCSQLCLITQRKLSYHNWLQKFSEWDVKKQRAKHGRGLVLHLSSLTTCSVPFGKTPVKTSMTTYQANNYGDGALGIVPTYKKFSDSKRKVPFI